MFEREQKENSVEKLRYYNLCRDCADDTICIPSTSK